MAQLIDAGDGRHIWAERYDRKLDNLFQLQDDISRHILEEIQAELTLGSQARTWRAKAGDAELFRLYVAGRRHFVVSTPEGHAESERLFTQAYERAPDNVLSNSNMAWIYFQKVLKASAVVLRRTAQKPVNSRIALLPWKTTPTPTPCWAGWNY